MRTLVWSTNINIAPISKKSVKQRIFWKFKFKQTSHVFREHSHSSSPPSPHIPGHLSHSFPLELSSFLSLISANEGYHGHVGVRFRQYHDSYPFYDAHTSLILLLLAVNKKTQSPWWLWNNYQRPICTSIQFCFFFHSHFLTRCACESRLWLIQ